MNIQILYLIGQIIEMVGVVLVFKYSTPKHVLTNSVWGNNGDSETRPKREYENKVYKWLSRIGLLCVLFGFSIQLPVSVENCRKKPSENNANSNTIPNNKTKIPFCKCNHF